MRQKMKKSSKRKREIKLKISFNKKGDEEDFNDEEKGNSQDQDSSNVSQAWPITIIIREDGNANPLKVLEPERIQIRHLNCGFKLLIFYEFVFICPAIL